MEATDALTDATELMTPPDSGLLVFGDAVGRGIFAVLLGVEPPDPINNNDINNTH